MRASVVRRRARGGSCDEHSGHHDDLGHCRIVPESDRGVPGYSTAAHRDGFEAALAALVDGPAATLVVWKLDRLSPRGIGQVGALLDDFERVGGRLVSVQASCRPTAGRMIIALLSEFARAESDTIGVRIKNAKEAQRAAGAVAKRQTALRVRHRS